MTVITINDRVRDALTDEAGTVIGIRNGYYEVELDNGDNNLYLECEIYPDIEEVV